MYSIDFGLLNVLSKTKSEMTHYSRVRIWRKKKIFQFIEYRIQLLIKSHVRLSVLLGSMLSLSKYRGFSSGLLRCAQVLSNRYPNVMQKQLHKEQCLLVSPREELSYAWESAFRF